MRILSILSGLLLLLFTAFSAGIWSTHKNWQPYQSFLEIRNVWRSIRDTGMILPEGTFRKRHSRAASTRYVVTLPEKVSPGYLAVTRIAAPDHRYVTDLLNADGEVMHTWPIDHSRIVEGSSESAFVHATAVLPDGSILANFDDTIGMGRFDVCGTPIWSRNDQVYHHSLRPDEPGQGYWTWQSKVWDGGHDQRMLRFDVETGETLESIDLIDDVMADRPDQWLSLIVPEGFRFEREAEADTVEDILHPNDVEPLPVALASAFPMFEAGDLLVSLRNIDLVAIIDRQTHKILWARYGPWRDQHDADWQPDGTITVYSNNIDRFQSTIVEIDPKTGKSRDVFYGTGFKFDSFIMGQHQHLPNGNWLIVSPMEGRLIEVTTTGEHVREFNNYIDENYNSVVTHAELLPPDYFETMPHCDG